MYKLIIPTTLMGKPRPRFLPNGKIISNVSDYSAYKEYVATLWRYLNGSITIDQSYPLYIGLMSFWKSKRGGTGDLLDNKIGAIMDSLVENKIITDDNARILAGDKIMSARANQDINVIVIDYLHNFREVDEHINNFWLTFHATKKLSEILVSRANTLPSLDESKERAKENRRAAKKRARERIKARANK